ncbi:MAG TPA: 30S ribosomal protein S8 [Candidatus Saccharimonadales bacterium]|nr:30S ribosomal protein S8 [Candidatus Saccharimonadales bacterium]
MSTTNLVSSDPIADMLSRIRNAIAVGQTQISLPHSKVKEAIARLLVSNGFLDSVKTTEEGGCKQLMISIAKEDEPARITELNRLSRPGRRMYVKSPAIPVVKSGRGMVIISTSQGIMTGLEASAKNQGGELICEVY